MDSNNFVGFAAMLKAALGHRVSQTAETFLDLVSSNIVMEFPYAPEYAVSRLSGSAGLKAYLIALADILIIDEFFDVRVHPTDDENVTIVEFSCRGRGSRTGNPYRQKYISIIETNDLQIVRYRDYWNPDQFLYAVGGREELMKALGGIAS